MSTCRLVRKRRRWEFDGRWIEKLVWQNLPLRNLLTRQNIRRNIRGKVSIFVPTLFRSRVFVRLCEAICSATLGGFPTWSSCMEETSYLAETRADIATRRHYGQSGKRAAGTARVRFARSESTAALAKSDASRRGARSCYSRAIPAKRPSGASWVPTRPLNRLGNSRFVQCNETLFLLFSCLTGENTRLGFMGIQVNPGFFGKEALCAVQHKVPARVSVGPGSITGPITGSITGSITGPITGAITGANGLLFPGKPLEVL